MIILRTINCIAIVFFVYLAHSVLLFDKFCIVLFFSGVVVFLLLYIWFVNV